MPKNLTGWSCQSEFKAYSISELRESEKFFEDFKDRIPQKWKNGAEFSYQDMINHLTSEILKDPKISENVRQKRFHNLLLQIDEKFHPTILEFVKDGKSTDVLEAKTLKGENIEVSLIDILIHFLIQYLIN